MSSKKRPQNQPKGTDAPVKKGGAVINKHIALWLYIALGAVTLAMFVMTIIASAGVSTVWHGMPVAIILALLGIAIAVSVVAFNPRKNFYSLGFYVLHIGIVLFLVGSMVYAIGGQSTNAGTYDYNSITDVMLHKMVQNGEFSSLEEANEWRSTQYHNQIGNSETGEKIDLGFNFRISEFVTEYYDEEQKNVKHYEATVKFLNKDGTTDSVSLTVNHPIYRNGWKIYLMDVSTDNVYGITVVQLMFKKDSTEFLSVAGILLTIVGTFMMCFIRPREKAGEEVPKGRKKSSRTQVEGGKA